MSEGFLRTMLDALTSGYSRKDLRNAYHSLPMDTNIGRLFSTFDFGLKIIQEQTEKIRLWDDIDNAKDAVLDRYAANFGVNRNGSTDPFLRLLIKVKMISLLSGGDIDTVINAAASLFGIPVENILLTEFFPAKLEIAVKEADLEARTLAMVVDIVAMLKRILASGVGLITTLQNYRELKDEIGIQTALFECSGGTFYPPDTKRTFEQTCFVSLVIFEHSRTTIKSVY